MKKYYKFIIILLIIAVFIPQIAFASWWNPFSWNIWNNIFHKTDTKTQVLENRVKELENKLSEQSTPTPAVTETNIVTSTEANEQAAQKATQQATVGAAAKKAASAQAAVQAQAAQQAEAQAAAQQVTQQAAAQAAADAAAAQAAQQAATQAEQDRLAKIEADKAQLQSIIASQLSSFNQQVSDISSQLTSKKAEMEVIKAQYAPRIELEKTRLASNSIIMARVAKLTDEMNAQLQPLIDEYNALVNKYNILIGAPLEIQTQSSTIPQYLKFYPDGNGGGDLYGNGGSYHLKVERTSYGFKIY